MTWRNVLAIALVAGLLPLSAQARAKKKHPRRPAQAAAAAPAEKPEAAPAAAPAPEAEGKAKARIHFQAGAAFYRESRYDDAIREFGDAYAYDPNPVLLFNIGQAHEKAGRVSDALKFYTRYVHDAPRAHDRTTVEISIRNLEASLAAQGIQQVAIYSDPPDATAAVDGKVLGPTPISADMKPGKHHLSVSLEGHKTVERDFGLYKGRSLDIDVTLEKGSGSVTAAPTGDLALFAIPLPETAPNGAQKAAMAKAPPKPKTAWEKLRWPGLAAAGLGVVLLAVGAQQQLARIGLEQQAAGEPTQTRYMQLSSDAHGAVGTSRIAFVIGGLAAAGGGALIMIDLGMFTKGSH